MMVLTEYEVNVGGIPYAWPGRRAAKLKYRLYRQRVHFITRIPAVKQNICYRLPLPVMLLRRALPVMSARERKPPGWHASRKGAVLCYSITSPRPRQPATGSAA